MSKILANEIANYGDNAPIDLKEGLNIPAGKPIQAAGSTGTNGQILSTTGSSIQWVTPFSGSYTDLTNKPTIPTAVTSLTDLSIVDGTAGQVLKTGGSGANPSWGTISSEMVELAHGQITSSTASINNAIPKNKKTDVRLLFNIHVIAKKPAINPEHVNKWTDQACRISRSFLFFSIYFFSLLIKILLINSCRGSNSCKLI